MRSMNGTMRHIRRLSVAALLAPWALQASAADGPLPPPELWETSQETLFDAAEIDINDFQWRARPVVVFADSPFNPAFAEQIDLLQAEIVELVDRDVVIITDTEPDPPSALRTKLRPRGFMLVLIGKDGEVKLRKPFPWDVRELSRVIDKMPMRQREIRSRDG